MFGYIWHLALVCVLFALVFWLIFTLGRMPKLREAFGMAVLVAASAFLVAPAWAAEAADSSVTIPIGDIINEYAVPLFAAITTAIAWMIRKLPAAAKSWIDTMRVEQLLDKAGAYGVNSVAGAVKGHTLTVNVHVPVLAHMLQYGLDRIPAYLLKWVGGPTSLAEMMWARLDVDEHASRPDLETLAEAIASGSSVAVAVAKVRTAGS